jgi:hypothetical protein
MTDSETSMYQPSPFHFFKDSARGVATGLSRNECANAIAREVAEGDMAPEEETLVNRN